MLYCELKHISEANTSYTSLLSTSSVNSNSSWHVIHVRQVTHCRWQWQLSTRCSASFLPPVYTCTVCMLLFMTTPEICLRYCFLVECQELWKQTAKLANRNLIITISLSLFVFELSSVFHQGMTGSNTFFVMLTGPKCCGFNTLTHAVIYRKTATHTHML